MALPFAGNNRAIENVQDYPRPPRLEPTPLRVQVIWTAPSGAETVIVDTTRAFRMLETTHPPSYYINPEDVKLDLLSKNSRSSFCEWKGNAAYHDLKAPETGTVVRSRIWSYPKSSTYPALSGHLAFYASSETGSKEGWRCLVEGEHVVPQKGDFYGSWITSEIKGHMKGGPGTWGM